MLCVLRCVRAQPVRAGRRTGIRGLRPHIFGCNLSGLRATGGVRPAKPIPRVEEHTKMFRISSSRFVSTIHSVLVLAAALATASCQGSETINPVHSRDTAPPQVAATEP